MLRLRISRRERHPVRQLSIETDLEGVLPGTGKGHVEHQHGTGLDIDHAGRRLTELHGAVAAEELGAALVHEPDPDRMPPDLGASAADPQHQMRARMQGGKFADPDVLEDPEDGELALLVDQGVVRQDREIDVQLRSPGSR